MAKPNAIPEPWVMLAAFLAMLCSKRMICNINAVGKEGLLNPSPEPLSLPLGLPSVVHTVLNPLGWTKGAVYRSTFRSNQV